MDNKVRTQFLTNTDETGRFIYSSVRTGRSYYVEPVGDVRTNWGSIDPANASGDLMHKKGDGKYRGSVDAKDSLITEANGFTKIETLSKGTSPLAVIEARDAQYPDKE